MSSANRRRAGNRRPGYGLIETVAIISFVGMLLSLSAVILHRSYRVHQRTLVAFRHWEQLRVWTDRFRADGHAAAACQIDADAHGVSLTREDGTQVRYTWRDATLVRSFIAEKPPGNEERWAGPALALARWTLDDSGRQPLLMAELEFDSEGSPWEPLVWNTRLGGQHPQPP
ncbi:MAG: hypothetical protein KDA45_00600 [Planctomycetales bacterium]|nr:hypothetical protein [Planctomycetales bacterium]